MDIWYTPERIALYQEIGRRRMARCERRAARLRKQERRRRVVEAFESVFGIMSALALFWACCLWAFM